MMGECRELSLDELLGEAGSYKLHPHHRAIRELEALRNKLERLREENALLKITSNPIAWTEYREKAEARIAKLEKVVEAADRIPWVVGKAGCAKDEYRCEQCGEPATFKDSGDWSCNHETTCEIGALEAALAALDKEVK